MNDRTALKIACKVLKEIAHSDIFKCYSDAYIEACNTLTAMQMGLDGDVEADDIFEGIQHDVLARDWDTPEEDKAWKGL